MGASQGCVLQLAPLARRAGNNILTSNRFRLVGREDVVEDVEVLAGPVDLFAVLVEAVQVALAEVVGHSFWSRMIRCGKDAIATLRENRLHEDSRVRQRAAEVPNATPRVALVVCLRRNEDRVVRMEEPAGKFLDQMHVAVELDGAHPFLAISCGERPRIFVFRKLVVESVNLILGRGPLAQE